MGVAVLSHMAASADIVVGRWEYATNNVPKGAVQALEPASRILLGEENMFSKTGEGVWQLPAGMISQPWPFEMAVKSGTLQITDTQAAAPVTGLSVEAPAVLQHAGIWLEADDVSKFAEATGHGSEENAFYIDRWYDKRETNMSSPAYPYGKSHYYQLADLAPRVSIYEDRPSVYFGGATSGACMDIMDASGSSFGGNDHIVKSIFIAHGVENTHGWLMGQQASVDNSNSIWWGKYATTAIDFNIFSEQATNLESAKMRNSRQWLNGKETDFLLTKVSKGPKLYEMAWDYDGVIANTLMAERHNFSDEQYVGRRSGGDHIYAVVVFTNVITEAERVQVRDYLMRKYLPAAALAATDSRAIALSPSGKVKLGGNTLSASLPDRSPLSLTGPGTLVKIGEDRLTVGGDYGEEPFGGSISLEAGSVALRDDIAFEPAAGVMLSSDTGPFATGTVVTASAAAADQFAVSGNARLTVRSIPSSVADVKVESGSLRLSGWKGPQCDPGEPFEVAIANGGFETDSGWTLSGDYAYLTTPNKDWMNFGAPEGSRVLRVRKTVSISQDVEIPVSGRYELSYYTIARGDTTGGHELDITLTHKASGNVYHVANVAAPFRKTCRALVKLYFPVTLKETGTYALKFKNSECTKDKTTFLDEVKLSKVDDDPEWIWRVPGGDFEHVDYKYGGHGFLAGTTVLHGVGVNHLPAQLFSASNTVAGWTFLQPDGWTDVVPQGTSFSDHYPPLGVASLSMARLNGNIWYDGSPLLFMNTSNLKETGASQLHFHKSCSSAAAVIAFTPPKGVWCVRMHVGRTNFGVGGVKVSARIGDGEWTDVGTVTPDDNGNMMKPYQWPGFIKADGASEVTLKIEPVGVSGDYQGCNIDNVVLIKKYSIQVKNNDFTTVERSDIMVDRWGNHKDVPVDWVSTLVSNKAGTAGWFVESPNNYQDVNWGSSSWGGGYRVCLVGRSAISQTLSFPEEGVYRLSFAHCRRYDSYPKLSTVDVNLVDASAPSVTNTLGSVLVHSPRFRQSRFDFRIPRAGEYTVEFRGTVDDYVYALLDDVRVERIPESEMGSVSLPDSVSVDVAEGAVLELEFTGTNKVSRFRYAGRSYSGVIDASNCPGIRGFGAMEVVPKGLTIIVR